MLNVKETTPRNVNQNQIPQTTYNPYYPYQQQQQQLNLKEQEVKIELEIEFEIKSEF